MTMTLTEICSGSAALSLSLIGCKKQIVPYQGSKWKHRKALIELMKEHDYFGIPDRIVMVDLSPWPIVFRDLTDKGRRDHLFARLNQYAGEDPRVVYDRLVKNPVKFDDVSADFLFLQRLSFSGKAVGIAMCGKRWSVSGFNSSSAYGVPATEYFGAVKPLLPSLIASLHHVAEVMNSVDVEFKFYWMDAVKFSEKYTGWKSCGVVYIDPPYKDQTGYPCGNLSRANVVKIAKVAESKGQFVMISESENLTDHLWRWNSRMICGPVENGRPFQVKKREYVTYTR